MWGFHEGGFSYCVRMGYLLVYIQDKYPVRPWMDSAISSTCVDVDLDPFFRCRYVGGGRFPLSPRRRSQVKPRHLITAKTPQQER